MENIVKKIKTRTAFAVRVIFKLRSIKLANPKIRK